ncbi:Tetratricopeptide repeat protein 25 [Clonorchis sinensis]|uniref:Outer dynein arm-docking complex subunit 4 n=1 Tax=Clonorchis sinensis TaxID=79923 RepID=A0A3R7DPC7_CLOSI|nr:Tetratricopeptide repeat protein 25 [Clonorchis sinensis]
MSEDSSERPAFNSVDAYYSVARTLQSRKEYQRALFYLALALKQNDKHIPSYLLRSLCHMYLCETDKALADVQTVLQYEPKNPHALLLLAEIYYLRGDFEEALQTFHRGRILRPTIEQFLVGVHKCETAIQNSCTDCKIRLTADLDLTNFYEGAFPRKKAARNAKILITRGKPPETPEDLAPWPTTRPKDIQRRLMGQGYNEFTYLEKMFGDETNRIQQLQSANQDVMPEMNATLNRSKENRKTAVRCGTYLDRHADLFHKLDPGFRHTKTDS